MATPKITVSDDDGDLSLFHGDPDDADYLGSYYGTRSFVVGLLREKGEMEAAAWVENSGAARVAWLTGMEVEDKGHGIGTAMVRRALAEFTKRGVEIVVLHAKADRGWREQLLSWYTKLGFTREGDLDSLPFFYMRLKRPKKRSSKRSSRRTR
jgi:GNAT superfamily N-acetyltransferase